MYFAIGKVGFELLFKLSFFILHSPLTFHIHVYHNMNAWMDKTWQEFMDPDTQKRTTL